MIEQMLAAGGMDKVFLLCAIGGGSVFLLWMVLQFVGGFDHGGGDVGHADISGHGDIGDHGDISGDAGFTVLSLQGLSSFFTMFGLVGLSFTNRGAAVPVATIGGTVAGFAMIWVMKRLFGFFVRMQSSGTLNVQNTVGQPGIVYLKIPADGAGKVQVTVQNRLEEFTAVSEEKEEIPTGATIKVVRVISGDRLAVVKA